jgi:hypothetical protein
MNSINSIKTDYNEKILSSTNLELKRRDLTTREKIIMLGNLLFSGLIGGLKGLILGGLAGFALAAGATMISGGVGIIVLPISIIIGVIAGSILGTIKHYKVQKDLLDGKGNEERNKNLNKFFYKNDDIVTLEHVDRKNDF